jgi:hypothetical protein
MNDTLQPKAMLLAAVTSTQLEASSRDFPRIVSAAKNSYVRSNSLIGSQSPTYLRIAHTPRAKATDLQRTLCAVDQDLARIDSGSNLLSVDKFKVAFQTDLPVGITETEYIDAVRLLVGILSADSFAFAKSLYRAEA